MNGPLATRLAYLLVAVSPLIAAAIAVPVLEDSPTATTAAQRNVEPRLVEPHSVAPVVSPDAALRQVERQVTHRLDALARNTHFAVSVRDEESGRTFDYGSGRFATASLVKVHLAALTAWRADRADAPLSGPQRNDIRAMLVSSDNDAALRTYYALGGPPGIEKELANALDESQMAAQAMKVLGLG